MDRARARPAQSFEVKLPPSVLRHCLFPSLPLLHTTPKRAAQHCPTLDALWSHPAEQLIV